MAIVEEFQFDNGSQTIANDVIENVQQQAEMYPYDSSSVVIWQLMTFMTSSLLEALPGGIKPSALIKTETKLAMKFI